MDSDPEPAANADREVEADAAQERLRRAQLAGRVGLFEWLIAENRIIWTAELEALYGLPEGGFGGRLESWAERVEPEDATRVLAEIEQALARHQDALSYEFRAVLPDGTRRWLAGQASFTYDAGGRPLRMIGVNVDVGDRKRAQARDAFLLGLDDAVRPLADPDAIIATIARRLGEHLDADRCAYAEVEDDQDTMNVTGNYTRDAGVRSIVGRLAFSSFGPEVLRLMRANRPFVADDVERCRPPLPDLSAYRATQIAAVICVPLHKSVGASGRLVAAMAVHARAPRRWREDEVALVLDVANRCWESIERARVARSLREAGERVEASLIAGEVSTWTWDLATDRIQGDRNMARLFGFPAGQIERLPAAELVARVHPEDRPARRATLEQALSGALAEYSVEYRVLQPDGAPPRWAVTRGRVERGADGRPVRIRGVVVDVTDRREAERAVKLSEARFRQFVDELPQLAWTARADGYIDWYNRRWYEYTGTAPADMAGWGWQAVHDPKALPAVIERWNASIVSGVPFEMEFPLRGVDGQFRLFLTRVQPLRDAEGHVVQWFGTNTDIEQQRRLLDAEREARAEAERVGRMKDEFLTTLSHELRTPLNAIMGWAQLLRRGKLSAAEQSTAVETIERNARAQTQMIEDLLDMSRIVSGKVRLDVQRVTLADVIDAALTSMRPAAEARQVRLEKILDPYAGPVTGDPARLQQVVWNLLSNAIKFTPAGGRVQVVLERVNSHLEINVADTGVGIKPEFLPMVFDRFQQADASTTRKFGGLGLGLSIVKQLVELHGGSVRCKSRGDGQGATFTVALPLAAATHDEAGRAHPGTDAPDDADAPLPSLAGLTVLVVDDEADARLMLKRVLEACDARVLTAANAADALRLAQDERPDLLLSDIGMPGTDGYQLMAGIRALGKDRGGAVPAVALTAFARAEDRRRALLAGFQSHVAKPVDGGELVAVVASLLGRTGG